METRTQKGAENLWDTSDETPVPFIRTRRVIVFGLRCDGGHEFEGWFRSNDDFDQQKGQGHLACPACASTRVDKAIMAPNISTGIASSNTNHAFEGAPIYGERPDLTDNSETIAQLEAEISEMRRQIKDELRDYVEDNFDDVGDEFASEARRRFYEEDERGIYGQAELEEVVSLVDEGIPVAPLPGDPTKPRKKLN